MNKALRKILSITILGLILLISTTHLYLATGTNEDSISIINPESNENIQGVYQFQWTMFDEDLQDIPFQIDLFQKSCAAKGPYVGTVADDDPEVSGVGNNYEIDWNTAGPIENRSEIEDGEYCVRVCAVFVKQSNNYYSLCDKKTVNIVNSGNITPRITSVPVNTNIQVGEEFTYQVEAEDPDSEDLEFSIQGPEFLNIDSASGLISSTGGITESGNFDVTVIVTDGDGGEDKQEFVLGVLAEGDSVSIDFISPKQGDIFNQDNNIIAWQIEPNDNIKSLALSYSQDASDWQSIVVLNPEQTDYTWEVIDFEAGEYYLLLEVEDEQGSTYRQMSEKFIIDNQGNGGFVPVINIVQPKENAEISSSDLQIIAEILPSNEAEIVQEGVKIMLDDQSENLSCSFEDQKVICEIEGEISAGQHKINIEVTDSQEQIALKEWTFTALDPNGSQNGPGVTLMGRFIPQNTILLASGVLCLGLLLLLVPLFLYSTLTRRRDQYSEQNNYAAPQPQVAYDTSFQPEIGSHMIGEEETKPDLIPAYSEPTVIDAAPVSASSAPSSTPDAAIQMPAAYADEEIPDWLKDFEASQPVAASGQTVDTTSKADAENEAKIHDDYGLALNNDEDTGNNQNTSY